MQGVFFRASAADEAKRLGIVGWVRNTEGGSVEGEAQGSSQQLETFRVRSHLLRPCSSGLILEDEQVTPT